MVDKKIVLTNEKIFIKAVEFQKNGNTLEASKIYQSLIKSGFKNPYLYFNYGLILFNKGKFFEAKSLFLKTKDIKDFMKSNK